MKQRLGYSPEISRGLEEGKRKQTDSQDEDNDAEREVDSGERLKIFSLFPSYSPQVTSPYYPMFAIRPSLFVSAMRSISQKGHPDSNNCSTVHRRS